MGLNDHTNGVICAITVISQLLQGPVLYVIASIQDKADMWNIFIQQLLITYLPSCVRAPKAAWLLLLISVIIYVLMVGTRSLYLTKCVRKQSAEEASRESYIMRNFVVCSVCLILLEWTN
jgi:Kef-type K+ transport system membrane component KefB